MRENTEIETCAICGCEIDGCAYGCIECNKSPLCDDCYVDIWDDVEQAETGDTICIDCYNGESP